MARVTLNYGASVPGVDSRVPFRVNTDPTKGNVPPGTRFKDYIPQQVSEVSVKADDRVKQKNFMRKPVVTSDIDYVNPNDAKAKRANDKSRIVEIAKTIYASQAEKRKTYEAAVETLEKSVDVPEKTLERARKIVDYGPPLTKQEAMEKAAAQFYGLKS